MGGCHEPVTTVTEQGSTAGEGTALPPVAFGAWDRSASRVPCGRAWRQPGEAQALGVRPQPRRSTAVAISSDLMPSANTIGVASTVGPKHEA